MSESTPIGNRDLLFVYGTLLSGDKGPTGVSQRARLARDATVLARGTVEGRLYDLGRYPGIVVPAPGELVHGEVLALETPERTLRWLDIYEGMVPGRHQHNEYERLRLPVTLEDGGRVEAWAYVYRGSLTGARHIGDGRWLPS